jgi:hypothetical protein
MIQLLLVTRQIWPNVWPMYLVGSYIYENEVLLQKGGAMEQSKTSFVPLLQQRCRVALVALLLALGLVYVGLASPSTALAATAHSTHHAAAAIGTVHGCPPYYACVYPENAGWNNNHPEFEWYYYGVYKIYNQYGYHQVYNNQNPGWFWLCDSSTCNGGNMAGFPPQSGTGGSGLNFTPIYAVALTPNATAP